MYTQAAVLVGRLSRAMNSSWKLPICGFSPAVSLEAHLSLPNAELRTATIFILLSYCWFCLHLILGLVPVFCSLLLRYLGLPGRGEGILVGLVGFTVPY